MIGVLILFNLDHGFFGKHYVYGTDAGCIIAIILKFAYRNNRVEEAREAD